MNIIYRKPSYKFFMVLIAVLLVMAMLPMQKAESATLTWTGTTSTYGTIAANLGGTGQADVNETSSYLSGKILTILQGPASQDGLSPKSTHTASFLNNSDRCLTHLVQFTLSSEQISFCAPTIQPYQVVEDRIADPEVVYAQLNQISGYGIVNIRSVNPGNLPGLGRPVYGLGGIVEYRQAIWNVELIKNDQLISSGPIGVFWNETVPSIQIDATLPTSIGNMKTRSVEWDVERAGQLWIFLMSWDTGMKNANAWQMASRAFAVQGVEVVGLADTAFDLGAAFLDSQMSRRGSILGGPVDVGPPAWWSGICDDNNYFSDLTAHNIHSNPIGVPWHGVQACGPVTYKSPYPHHVVPFFSGTWGEIEFECVELSMRFLYQEWGIQPWSGDANTIKDSPPASMVFYPNGTHAIVPGDILTENGTTQNSYGHTMIITGTINILEQNASSNGSRSLYVTNWNVNPDAWVWGETIQGWLHAKINIVSPIPTQTSTPTATQTLASTPTPTIANIQV